jgi:PKD repeat protein
LRARGAVLGVLALLLSTAAPAFAGTPTASFTFSPDAPYPDEKITLTSTSTPPDKLTAWDWDLDNDGQFDDATGSMITHTFADTGEHVVGLRVTDTDAVQDQTTHKITVIAQPKAAFTVAPPSPQTNQTITLTATQQASLTGYAWDLDNDGDFDDATGTSTTTSFPDAGKHTVALKVTDQRGTTDADATEITVTAPQPTPTPTPTPSPTPAPPPFGISDQTPTVGQPVAFDAGPLDHGHGGVKDHKWDLDGDGKFERDTHQSPEVSVVYGQAGPITAAVQVSYADGATVTDTGGMQVGPGTAPTGCGVYCQVGFPFHPDGGDTCVTLVEVGLVQAKADCFKREGNAYSTTGRVRVNGLDLYPITGGTIKINTDTESLESTGGLVTLQYAEFTLAHLNDIVWDGLGGTDGEAVMPNIIPGPTTEIEGFGITGRLGVTFHEHRATFDAHVELPDGMGGFDAQLRLTVTAEDPATLDELRIVLPVGELQDTLPIDHLILDYAAAANRWLGDVGVSIGDYDVGAAVGFHTIPEAALDELRASVGGLNVSIYAGVFLQEIRFGYGAGPPPVLDGGITLSYGPEYLERSLVSVDADLHLDLGDPFVIRMDGEGKILGLKSAEMQLRYVPALATFDFDAQLRLGVNPLGPPRPPWWDDSETPPFARIEGAVHGWIDGPANTFNAEGSGRACFGACFGATVLMSSIGTAGCAHLGAGSVGAAYRWVPARFNWLAGACDLGPWRASHTRAASTERTLALPADLDVAAFKIVGTDGAPRVTVTGPKGEQIVTPAGAGGKTDTSLVTLDPGTKTTYVAIGSPSGGIWRITADPGSSPITDATSARALPDVHVTGKVRGKGRRRTLRYRIRTIPGQTVVFAERGRHKLGKAHGARGTLHFTPGDGPAGKRTIVAQVGQDGLPRDEVTVASYRAPKPARPGRPGKVKLKRKGHTLRITWRASHGHPSSYELRAATINGREELYRLAAGKRRVTLTDIFPADAVKITITPFTAKHQPGRARRVVARKVRV